MTSVIAYSATGAAERAGVQRAVVATAIRNKMLTANYPTARPVIFATEVDRWIAAGCPTTLGWYVYRCYDADDLLLYVGCSSDVDERLYGHHKKPWWPDLARVTRQGPMSKSAGLVTEARAIRHEHPLHNLVHSPDRGLPFAERHRITAMAATPTEQAS